MVAELIRPIDAQDGLEGCEPPATVTGCELQVRAERAKKIFECLPMIWQILTILFPIVSETSPNLQDQELVAPKSIYLDLVTKVVCR